MVLASLTVVGPDFEAGPADWWGGDTPPAVQVRAQEVTAPPEPELRLPADPDVEPGDESFSPGRLMSGVMRHLYSETREFLLSSYALAV